MAEITLPNVRQASTVTAKVHLSDNGVDVDWSGLNSIRAELYSDERKVVSGAFAVTVDPDDGAVLICKYPGSQYEHLGVNRIVILAVYHGQDKAYDKPLCNFVPRTADVSGEQVVIDDPEIDVEIIVDEVSTSLLDSAIAAAFNAAEKANTAAGKGPYLSTETGTWFVYDYAAGEYVDTGVPGTGKSIYEIAVQHGYTGTEEEFLNLYMSAIAYADSAARAAAEAAAAAHAAADDCVDAAASADDAAGRATEAAEEASAATEDARVAASKAETEAAYAKDAGDGAYSAASRADSSADRAEAAADDVEQAITDATTATGLAEAAALSADDSAALAKARAQDAESAARHAKDQGDYAKDQGDYAKTQVDAAKGDFESLDDRFDATEEAAIEIAETTDPDSPEYQDEYQRVLSVLYQAIDDVRVAMTKMENATADATAASGSARGAARDALAAAAAAAAQAKAAMDAASAAVSAMGEAKGDFNSIDERLDDIEAKTYRKPEGGIPLGDLDSNVQDSIGDGFEFIPTDDPSSFAE